MSAGPEPSGEALSARAALALGAMSAAARVVSDADQAAIPAVFGVAAERCSPARHDCAHDAALDTPEMPSMRLAIAAAAEDLRHLEPPRHDGGSGGLGHLRYQPIERAGRAPDGSGRDLGIASSWTGRHGRAGPGCADVVAGLEQVGGKAMAQVCIVPACGTRSRHGPCGRRLGARLDRGGAPRSGRESASDAAARPASSRVAGQATAATASRIRPWHPPCSTRISMRLLSMSAILSRTTSDTRSPAA